MLTNKSTTILIVDDEPDNLDVLNDILLIYCFSVLAATSGTGSYPNTVGGMSPHSNSAVLCPETFWTFRYGVLRH